MSSLASGFAKCYTVQRTLAKCCQFLLAVARRTLAKCQFLLAVARGQHLLSYRQVHCQVRLASVILENTQNIDILLIFFF